MEKKVRTIRYFGFYENKADELISIKQMRCGKWRNLYNVLIKFCSRERERSIMLRNGSDEHWKLRDQADYIYRQAANSRTSDERRKWAEKGKNLAYGMREKYGFSDEIVERLINDFYLERL